MPAAASKESASRPSPGTVDPAQFRFQLRVDTQVEDYPSGWRTIPFHVPVNLIRGLYEQLTTGELTELLADLHAEEARRNDDG